MDPNFYMKIEAVLEVVPFEDVQVPGPEVDLVIVDVGGLAARRGTTHLEID